MDKNRYPEIFPNGIDLRQQEAKNMVLQNSTEPNFNNSTIYKKDLDKKNGLIIFDPDSKHAKVWVDDVWKTIAYFGEGGGGGGIIPSEISISELKDVNVVTLQNGDVLTWDGSKWVNKLPEIPDLVVIDENDIDEIMKS